jgi:hypothetical protein
VPRLPQAVDEEIYIDAHSLLARARGPPPPRPALCIISDDFGFAQLLRKATRVGWGSVWVTSTPTRVLEHAEVVIAWQDLQLQPQGVQGLGRSQKGLWRGNELEVDGGSSFLDEVFATSSGDEEW